MSDRVAERKREGGETRREKSLRNGVHHANAVVWEPGRERATSFGSTGVTLSGGSSGWLFVHALANSSSDDSCFRHARASSCADHGATNPRGLMSMHMPSVATTTDSPDPGPFYTSECRGGVQRRQVELKGAEDGD